MSKSNKYNKSNKIIPKDAMGAIISNLIDHGRIEISSKDELVQFSIGSTISYININNHFKHGGFIVKFSDDYFIYVTPDFNSKYRVRYKNISKMWVGDVYSTRNDIVSIVKTSQNKTNFPVKINNIVVYYAARNFDKKRYMNTIKYKTMINWYHYFISDDIA